MANSRTQGKGLARVGRGPESALTFSAAVVSEPRGGQSMADILQRFFVGKPWVVVTDQSRARLDGLGFCDYWYARFSTMQVAAGRGEDAMAQHILDVAIEQDGTQLVSDIAESIGQAFGSAVLEADIDGVTDSTNGLSLQESNLGELARILLDLRVRMEAEENPRYPNSVPVSDSWITFAHSLSINDPIEHAMILEELQGAGYMGDEDLWDTQFRDPLYEAVCDTAEALAKHFPEVVIGKLREPRRHNDTFDGAPITWFPSVREKQNWAAFAGEGLMSHDKARENLRGFLSQEFLAQTLTAIDPTREASFTGLQVQLLQMGKKCNVFLVNGTTDSGKTYPFVVMQAKGERLSSEIEDDYGNLRETYSALESHQISPFAPKPYVLDEYEGISAFSVEYLSNHDEVTPRVYPIILPNGLFYTALIGNSGSEATNEYNNHLSILYRQLAGSDLPERRVDFDEDIRPSLFYSTSEAVKAEIIARLYVIQRLLGRLPREFLLGAGDFMANFDAQVINHDPRLITIRGGWQEIADNDFPTWIQNRKDTGIVSGRPERGEVFVFSDPQTISLGIRKGERMLKLKAFIS